MIGNAPYVNMENAIAAKLETDLELKTIIIPEDINARQKADQHLTIAWDRFQSFSLVNDLQFEIPCQFSLTIEFKDIRHTVNAKNVLWAAVQSLAYYRPFSNFEPLMPISGGYAGFNEVTSFIKYNLILSAIFNWNKYLPSTVQNYPNNQYIESAIELSLWNAPNLPNTTNAVKQDILL
jgi:hypothetical protein